MSSHSIPKQVPKLPPVSRRLALYQESAPRDAVNSLSNHTAKATCLPKPHYVPPVVNKYRPCGSARDLWINQQGAETQGLHFESDVNLYWKEKMGLPEYRGKSKGALCSDRDRFILYPHLRRVHNHPLVPTVARAAQLANRSALPVKKTVYSGRWKEYEQRHNAIRCDSLLQELQG